MQNSSVNLFKALFQKEEIRGDRTITYIRIAACFVLAFLSFAKAGLFTGLVISQTLILTNLTILVALLYSILLLYLYKKDIYHTSFKYFSVTIDISLIVLSIFFYRFDVPAEYAKTLFLARYAILPLFIFLTVLRYSFILSLYAGVYASILYAVLVLAGNYMYGTEFSFIGPDGQTYISQFSKSEAILKAVYLLLAGIAVSFTTNSVRRLVTESITREQEKGDLDLKNKLMDTVNKENRKYLDNILDGLLLINKDYTISSQFSRSLVHIFEHESISGLRFVDFIYPDEYGQADKRRELNRYLKILFNSTMSDYDMIEDVNPLKDTAVTITDITGNTKEKFISVFFHRVYEETEVSNILVIVKDMTQIKRAEKQIVEERRRHENEVETIASILNVGPAAFSGFMADAIRILNEIEDEISSVDNPLILARLFRSLHTLKGTARTIGFRTMADITHEFEEHLARIREGDVAVTDDLIDELKKDITGLFDEYENIKKLNERFHHFSLAVSNAQDPTDELEDFIKTLRRMAEEEAESIDKKIEFSAAVSVEKLPFTRELRGALIHLVRNAVDHGIEDTYERIAAEKDEKGNIALTIRENDNSYIIEIADDGKGIDYDKIKADALKSGRITDAGISKSDILKLLFQPGFSTKKKTSALSGRGVGLDAVLADVKALGGQIRVSSDKGKGTRFTVIIPGKN